jgi:hypothetical protein
MLSSLLTLDFSSIWLIGVVRLVEGFYGTLAEGVGKEGEEAVRPLVGFCGVGDGTLFVWAGCMREEPYARKNPKTPGG